MNLLRRRPGPLSCREVVELVTDYLEGALGPSDRARIEAHLTGCDPCIDYLEQIRTTVAVAEQVEPEAMDAATRERLVALYRTWQHPPAD